MHVLFSAYLEGDVWPVHPRHPAAQPPAAADAAAAAEPAAVVAAVPAAAAADSPHSSAAAARSRRAWLRGGPRRAGICDRNKIFKLYKYIRLNGRIRRLLLSIKSLRQTKKNNICARSCPPNGSGTFNLFFLGPALPVRRKAIINRIIA